MVGDLAGLRLWLWLLATGDTSPFHSGRPLGQAGHGIDVSACLSVCMLVCPPPPFELWLTYELWLTFELWLTYEFSFNFEIWLNFEL